MITNDLFLQRIKTYFPNYEEYLNKLNEPCTRGLFLNTKKDSRENILKIIDFDIKESNLTVNSFYHHNDNIGKSIAYELGLIYPQEISASIPATLFEPTDVKLAVDLCSAPGGKTINVLNRLGDDALVIANEYNYKRAQVISSNLERLGLSNAIITNKDCNTLARQLKNMADLVILDAPCSGEGMIRKYPEILDNYSLNNILELASLQKDLLENAYGILKGNGQLLYSTCTYALEEDEDQINNFLDYHRDMHLVKMLKLSPLNNTEGQFMALMVKETNNHNYKCSYKKSLKNKLVDDFIKNNLDIKDYYLYANNNRFYLSFVPIIDLGNNVIRSGVYIGEVINNRFEPSHCLYRSNLLKDKFKFRYEINNNEYAKYLAGYELKTNLTNGYYLISYLNNSLGFGKCVNGIIKNKYPKGLRRMI